MTQTGSMGLISAAICGTPGRYSIIDGFARSGKAFTARLGAAAECQAPRRRSHRRGLLPQPPRNEDADQQHDGAAERERRHGAEMDQAEAMAQRSNRLAHDGEG